MLIPPRRDDLIADLRLLREKGLPALTRLDLPALGQAARILINHPELDDAALIETVVRRGAMQLGGGTYGVALGQLLGLGPDQRVLTAGVRRTNAANALNVSLRTLTRRHEALMLEQLAAQILRLCTEQRLTEARGQLEPRSPAESALSLHWIEMFQAYYRLYTPISVLGGDLTAYRSTLIEDGRPYDRRYGTEGTEDIGYSQEDQAEGYATYALYHYTLFEWELRRFINRYGGMWMLSDPQAEQDAPDAIHRIRWHVNPFNERDQSFLRNTLDETPNQELHAFLSKLAGTELGRITHQEWQEWVATCECVWAEGADTGADRFPTSRNQPGISERCQVHRVIEACSDYMRTIDEDWNRTADWYRIPEDLRRDESDEQRYGEWRNLP
jgi:hypothetical protein